MCFMSYTLYRYTSVLNFFYSDTTHQMNEYALILEYANNDMLNNYLNEHFYELNWDDKCRLAFQLADALVFLNEKDIIHRNLVCVTH